ncbi:flagellar biosynthetic protein FliR, partial [Planococcus sp. SIMBA_143]
ILSAVQIAGGFIDFQMGFAIANVIDPQTGAQSPLTGQYFYIFSLLFLLAVDGHHLLIDGIYNSYSFIPVDTFIPFGNQSIADFVI